MLIDNKLITIRTWSGYVLEHVVSLWYAQQNSKKCKESELERDNKISKKVSFTMSRPEFCKQNSKRKEKIYSGKQTKTAR